ncbi:MAG: hypothetical protein MUC34_09675 [Anaerolineae bacterium]|nr:hypothetical protein [Anaerolineae bacterium]
MALPAPLRRGAAAAAVVALAALLLAAASAAAEPASPDAGWNRAGKKLWAPALYRPADPPPSDNRYETIPIIPPPTGLAAADHGDLNLALRGYSSTGGTLGFVIDGGPTDPGAPQMPGIFADNRTPKFTSLHRVNDWNWGCGAHGCRGNPISSPPVTLLGMGTKAGEPLRAPSRGAEIYPGGYKTLVLYADASRITLKYTREDNVVSGYTVHLEGLRVDPNLLDLYRGANEAGRWSLPAVRDGQVIGTASGSQVLVAVRDNGSFLDPRSRKDWWQGR